MLPDSAPVQCTWCSPAGWNPLLAPSTRGLEDKWPEFFLGCKNAGNGWFEGSWSCLLNNNSSIPDWPPKNKLKTNQPSSLPTIIFQHPQPPTPLTQPTLPRLLSVCYTPAVALARPRRRNSLRSPAGRAPRAAHRRSAGCEPGRYSQRAPGSPTRGLALGGLKGLALAAKPVSFLGYMSDICNAYISLLNIYVYIYIYVFIYIKQYIYIYVCICVCVCVCVYIYTYTHIYIHIYIYTYIHIYIYTYIHIYIYTYINVYIHM